MDIGEVIMALIIGLVICCVMSGVVSVGYIFLNKEPEKKGPLISDTAVAEFKRQQQELTLGIPYSNIYDARISTVIKTNTNVTPKDCKSLCEGTAGCQGFQMYPDKTTCDLFSNANTTFSFKEPGWNLFMMDSKLHMRGFDSPIVNQSISGSRIGSVITGITTREYCAPLCASNTNCTAFTVSSGGCSIHTNDDVKVYVSGANTYTLKNIMHSPATF